MITLNNSLRGIVVDSTVLTYGNPVSGVIGIIVNKVNEELRRFGKDKKRFFRSINNLNQALEYLNDSEEFYGIDEIIGAMSVVKIEEDFNEMIEASLEILEETTIIISFRDAFIVNNLIDILNKLRILNNPKLNLILDLDPEILASHAVEYFSKKNF